MINILNMLAISLTVNVLWIVLSVVISFVAGFILRGSQTEKLKKQIGYLEKEMLINHAEILHLHEALVSDKSGNANQKTLVVAMKDVPAADDSESRKVK